MEGISDIKIVGIDTKRPPLMQKEPYINLYFSLSHQAISGWCSDFNRLTSRYQYTAKIDEKEGLYIETWVRETAEIAPQLNRLKASVQQCSDEYIAKINAATNASASVSSNVSAEQVHLNKVIAALNFD
jgi:hypothetical protein